MPESHKAEKRREQKNNVLAGIGDATGRIVRVKADAIMLPCTVCQQPMKATKTNTELKAHAEGKHSKTLDECFPTAAAAAADLMAVNQKGATGVHAAQKSGPTKAETKKKMAAGLDDLLSAGLSTGKKGKK